MYNFKLSKPGLAIIFLAFVCYLVWLFRAYTDVVWMDQIQWLAGNLNHMYGDNFTFQDLYYLTPYNQSFSIVWAFINCKLFHYNTFIDNILSGVLLMLMASYYIKANLDLFARRLHLVFIFISCFIVFGLHKWEASLNGMGLGFYLVFFIILVLLNLAHKFYLNQISSSFLKNYFLPIYFLLSLVPILEYGPYFIPFQLSLIGLLLLNFKLFRSKVDVKKWRQLLLINFVLIVTSILITWSLNTYAASHPYEPFGKATVSSNLITSLHKLAEDPIFVIKFFLIANSGNLIDADSTQTYPFLKTILPFAGLLLLTLYGYCIYLFIKKRKLEYLYPINLILFVVIFYALVTISRLHFNDLYYGLSSRYTAVTFSGILALATIFLSLCSNQESIRKKALYFSPVALILISYLSTAKRQWQIAPYRKMAYNDMVVFLKTNRNLMSLQGNTEELTTIARNMLIKYQLNVFKPGKRLKDFSVNSEFEKNGLTAIGFYDQDAGGDKWRWTNGTGEIVLPNLYTSANSIRVKLYCTAPQKDTPMVFLNDNIYPVSYHKFDKGFEYNFPIDKQHVIFRTTIVNKPFVPKQVDSTQSTDERKLGLIFNSLSFQE
jgi:hypothetical protein